ncbi:MAG: Hsp20/alpha crystallin family protein [Nitrospirales bacterium]|nr:Hsp20/alpha crystallin family protein [Nitrospirales bacterium]
MEIDDRDLLKDLFSFRGVINKLAVDANTGESALWRPAVDIYETVDSFVVMAEIPEMGENALSIKMDGNVLRLRGERRMNRSGRSYHRVERAYGSFSRSFVLPSEVDHNRIRATLCEGVLTISLPKTDKEEPRHIEIG